MSASLMTRKLSNSSFQCLVMITVTLINVVNSCPRPWGIRAPDTRKMIDLDVMWEAYTDQHRNSIQNLESKRISASQSRLLIVVLGSADGWGNRLPSIVTGAIAAILSNRTLIVRLDTQPGQKGYFELSEFLDFCFPWRYNVAVLEELIQGQPSQALSWEEFLDWDWLDSKTQQGGPPVLTYRSYDYDVPALQSNPSLHGFFTKYFPDGEVHSNLWSRVYHPSQSVVRTLEKLKEKYHLQSHHVVGIQIRMAKAFQAGCQGFEIDNFFLAAEAAVKTRTRQGHAQSVRDPGRNGSSSASQRLLPAMFFIASDMPANYKLAVSHFGRDHVLFTDNKIELRQQGSDGTNPGTEMTGIVDLFMLSLCNDLVISFASTFGGVAAGMSGVKPVYIYPRCFPNLTVYPKFFRGLTSEPCMMRSNDHLAVGTGAQQAMLRKNPFLLQHMQCHWYDPVGMAAYEAAERLKAVDRDRRGKEGFFMRWLYKLTGR